MKNWATLGVPPPRRGAPRSETGRFVRDLQLRCLVVSLLALIVIVLVGVPARSIWLVMAGVALLALDACWLTIRIRRQAARGE
jgi:hypothetical protein